MKYKWYDESMIIDYNYNKSNGENKSANIHEIMRRHFNKECVESIHNLKFNCEKLARLIKFIRMGFIPNS